MIFLHRDDIADRGFDPGDMVDLVSEWEDGSERCAPSFRIVEYDTPRGCAAAYYPETNPLIPLDSKAEGSNTPTSKSVVVRLEPAREGAHTGITKAARDDAETGHKRPIDTSPPS